MRHNAEHLSADHVCVRPLAVCDYRECNRLLLMTVDAVREGTYVIELNCRRGCKATLRLNGQTQ